MNDTTTTCTCAAQYLDQAFHTAPCPLAQAADLREQTAAYMAGLCEANGWAELRRFRGERWLGLGALTLKLEARPGRVVARMDDGAFFEWSLSFAYDDAHAGADEALVMEVLATAERMLAATGEEV